MNFNTIFQAFNRFLRYLRSVPSRIRALPATKILLEIIGWFQEELWRIYFLEWFFLISIAGYATGIVVGADIIPTSIVGSYIMARGGGGLMKLLLYIADKLRKWSKIPAFSWAADFWNYVFYIIFGINYALIARFSKKKITPSPLKRLALKGRWKGP